MPTDTARLFFAAWPQPDMQEALHLIAQGARVECGGRAVPQRNIHMTLAFLGDVDRARLSEIEAAADGIAAERCQLMIDRLEYWRHNRILYAGVESCPETVRDLVAGLSGRLRAGGYKLDTRPYVPHVTLLRNARQAPAETRLRPIAWPVDDFALVESVAQAGGRSYQVRRRWPLTTCAVPGAGNL